MNNDLIQIGGHVECGLYSSYQYGIINGMKISFVCPDDLSAVLYTKTLISLLNARGFTDITLLCPIKKDHLNEMRDLNFHHIPVTLARFFSPIHDLLFCWTVYCILKREKYDLVLSWTTKPNLYCPIAAWLARVPHRIIAIRGAGAFFAEHKSLKARVTGFFGRLLYRNACNLSTRAWFTNPNDLNYFTNNRYCCQSTTYLSRNAISLNKYSPSSVSAKERQKTKELISFIEGEKVVLMVARLIISKGVCDFMAAAKLVQQAYSHVRFVLVAPHEDGSQEAIPESEISAWTREPGCVWLEYQSNLLPLFDICDVAVLPSYYKEGGYPRALLEPMAFSKPVISSDSPDCSGPVINNYNGYHVPRKSPQKLRDAILKIIESDELATTFGRRSREIVEKDFDDEKVLLKVADDLIFCVSATA